MVVSSITHQFSSPHRQPCEGCNQKKVTCVQEVCMVCLQLGEKCDKCRRNTHPHDLDFWESHSESGSRCYSLLLCCSPTHPCIWSTVHVTFPPSHAPQNHDHQPMTGSLNHLPSLFP